MSNSLDASPASTPPPPQFYPINIHPEFGYFWPMPPWRHRARTACRAAAFGLIAGAVAVFALMRPEEPSMSTIAVAAHALQPSLVARSRLEITPAVANAAYGSPCRTAPWPYAGTGCLAGEPEAWVDMDRVEHTAAAEPKAIPAPPPVAALPPLAEERAAPVKPVKRPQKAAARREPRKERVAREPDPRSARAAARRDPRGERFAREPDPRSAYASHWGYPTGRYGGWGGGGYGGGWW
jgi:hypothetical protein